MHQWTFIKTIEQYAASYKKMEKEGTASRLGALSYADVLATAKAKLVELNMKAYMRGVELAG